MKERILVFDMDGTIADFYGVENWLVDLKNESIRPYAQAKPLVNMVELKNLLLSFKEKGFKVIVTSWLANYSTKEYKNRTRQAKIEWLEKYNFPYDEIHLVQYGTTKANCTRKYGKCQILIDDNKKVRDGWKLGRTIDANKDIIKELKEILKSA